MLEHMPRLAQESVRAGAVTALRLGSVMACAGPVILRDAHANV